MRGRRPRRYFALVVALAAAAPALSQTAKPAAAAVEEEKGPTTIDAERLEGVGELDITARGSAEIKQDDLTIFGETLRYNREFGRVEGDGGVRLQMGADRFFGPRLRYNTVDDTGVFEQPGYILRGEEPARGNAESIEFRGKDQYRLKNAAFTTCNPGQEDWRLEADQLDLDYESEEGRARNARLKFFETTILASPFAQFPLERRRKSGILSPYYGHNSRRGVEVGLPYYWNIAPERDATITPVYMINRGLQLKNELRYVDRSYSGEARFEYMPGDKLFRAPRQGVTWQHTHRPVPGMNIQVDYNRVSDDRYFVDLASHVRQISVGNLHQDAFVQYGTSLFGLGIGTQARIQRFQTLQDPLAPITPPFHRVPQLNFGTGKNDIGGFMDASLPGEFVRFSHPTFVRGNRFQLNPSASAPVLTPGWFFTPKAGLRFSTYSLNQVAVGQTTSPRVTVPWFSLDGGLVFDREARWFGQDLTQTLEPRVYYVYVPYRNQDSIPLFDTGLADLSFPQIFSENRFGGGDRFGDANQVTYAVTSRFLTSGGQEAFRATLGQRYYFADERVALTPGAPLRTASSSDILASIGGRLFRYWTFDTTAQYDHRRSRPQRYTASVRYSPELAKVITAAYRFNRDTIKQIDVAAQWPVRQGWYAIGRYNYSIFDKRLLEGIFGVEYNAGCWVFRAVARRVQAAAQVVSTEVFFQIELTGVGELGSDEAVNLLKRNVPGYTVTNPRDQTLVPPSARPRLPFPMVY
jgi:LPS-assembly protein